MIQMIKNVFDLLDKSDRKNFIKYAILCVIAPVIDLFSLSAIIPILSKIQNKTISDNTIIILIGLGCLVLGKGIFEIVKSNVSTQFIFNATKKLSLKVFSVHNRESLLEHNDRTSASMLTAVRTDCAQSIGIIVNAVSICISFAMFGGLSIIIIVSTKWLGVLTCIAIFFIMLLTYSLNRARIKKYGERMRTNEIKLNAIVTTAFGSFKEIKISTNSNNMLKRYEDKAGENAKLQQEYQVLSTLNNVLVKNTIQASVYFALAVILIMNIDIASHIAIAIVYITILIKMIPETNAIVTKLNAFKFAEKSYNELMSNINSYSEIEQNTERIKKLRKKSVTINKGIRVENLSFSYPNGHCVFEDANVFLPANHTIAIVGNSGMGKTSFLDLILGLLRPSKGHIYYDDYDIVSESDSNGPCYGSLGEIASYIPQVVYMWGDSVKNNVLFMTNPDEADDNRVMECLKCAHVWDDVARMPEGMDTIIGANGTNISGGQRQRIALARALYRDFDLLIMDEATAALDSDTEHAVIDSIREMKEGKTLILVTHHMSLAEECEYIYKIEDKKIVKVR